MKRFEDGLDDGVEVCLHIAVPEAQNTITSRSQETITPSIIGGALNMLTPVQFDDDAGIGRGEIADAESDLVLPSELEAAELSAPQTAPREALGIGLLFAESADMLEHAED